MKQIKLTGHPDDQVVTDWHWFFMEQALINAKKSKDQSSQLGAVIVRDKSVISAGYNGMCRGVIDPFDDENAVQRAQRPEKYFWYEHAERNSIYNAARHGIIVKDSDMYTNGVPCCDCARGVIQAGIKRVYVSKAWNGANPDKWDEHAKRSMQMFEEAGVECFELDGEIGVTLLRNGQKTNY